MATITSLKRPEIQGQDCSAEKDLTEDNDSGFKEIEENGQVRKICGMDDEEFSRSKKKVKASERPDSSATEVNTLSSSSRRTISHEDYITYRKQVKESGGFDVGRFKGMICAITPLNIERAFYQDLLPRCCEKALEVYNRDEETNYKFQELVKANGQVLRGLMLFITFKARDPSEQSCVIFQAKVYRLLNDSGLEGRDIAYSEAFSSFQDLQMNAYWFILFHL
ncbi:UPF0725 protein [Senna tora]|uniref:UPF0725 protein n=1 Tax=Senna tora TaxID=362788 RepID=A0A834WNJ6_9FABA|nr:UPF0725 protein [Senna tora]